MSFVNGLALVSSDCLINMFLFNPLGGHREVSGLPGGSLGGCVSGPFSANAVSQPRLLCFGGALGTLWFPAPPALKVLAGFLLLSI